VIGIILVLLGAFSVRSTGFSLTGIGCMVAVGSILIAWPLCEYLSLLTVMGMADGFGPAGVINGGFYISLLIYLFITGAL
jgi:hypothetical protein